MSNDHLGRWKCKFSVPQTRCTGMTVEWWKVILRYFVEATEQNPLAIMSKWDFPGQVGAGQDHVLKDKTLFFLASDTEVAEWIAAVVHNHI